MISSAAIPAGLHILADIEFGDVRFDVKQGRTIQHVNAFDVEVVAFHTEKMNYRKSNWIGSARITGGKDAVFLIIQKRFDLQFITLRAINQVQQKYM